MKRFLPFLIIFAVALLTAGAAIWLYRAKMSAPPPVAAIPKTVATSAHPPLAAAGLPAAAGEESLHVLGPATAPATLEIYGDFQCPPCAKTTVAIDQLKKDYGDQLRVVFHEFPLAMHAHALPAAMAAEAAGLQGHFWEMHDLLYKYQSVWSQATDPTPLFRAYAQTLGLDGERFAADAQSNELKARIMMEGDAGVIRGVKNTPTLFINGTQMLNIFDEAGLRAAISAAVAGKKTG